MSIRSLCSDDIPGLASALAELPLLVRYGRGAAAIARDLELALARGEGLVVEESSQGVVACAWFLPSGTLGMGGYLKLIAVTSRAQRRGIGGELLEVFEAACAKQGRHAYLLVSDFNQEAQRFYQGHGYQCVGKLPALILPDVDELIYWKRLVT